MGFQTNFIAGSEVKISGESVLSIPLPSSSQTPIHAQTLLSTTNITTVYTVPAGYTFYLFGGHIYANAAGSTTVYENDGTTTVMLMRSTTDYYSSACPIAVYTAGQLVKAQTNAATVNIQIYGILVAD